MIDVEQQLQQELERLLPVYRPLDWDEVLARAGKPGSKRRRSRWLLAAAVIAAAGVVSYATPLGAAVARGLGDFSAWLHGEPGTPASPAQQQAFARANARSWLHFPPDTKLRQLASVVIPTSGEHVDLLGFRAGSQLCLRVLVTGKRSSGTQSCAPLADLRQAGSPVRVVLVDHGFGHGDKQAWYGVDRFHAPAIQVTAGIAADSVRTIVVEDTSGRHAIRTSGNAFMYVAVDPDVGQRVSRIWIKSGARLVPVPFAPALFGIGVGMGPLPHVPGPTRVQRHLSGGTIGWLVRHRPIGQPLSVIPGRAGALVRRHVVFGRVVTPDPGRPARIAVTLSTSRHGGKAIGVCSWLLNRGGSGTGGCAVRATLFKSSPLTETAGLVSGSDEFSTLSGLASDDVARIVAFLADGEHIRVPLANNTYLIDIARSKLPARLVAYDSHGRIIGIGQPIADMNGGASPARGKAHQLLHVAGPAGATADLLVGPSTTGGQCLYVRYQQSAHAGGTMIDCAQPTANSRSALALSSQGQPTWIVMGRVAPAVAHVRLRFADGDTSTVTPTQGFILTAIAKPHLQAGHELVSAQALSPTGKVIAHESFHSPVKRSHSKR